MIPVMFTQTDYMVPVMFTQRGCAILRYWLYDPWDVDINWSYDANIVYRPRDLATIILRSL